MQKIIVKTGFRWGANINYNNRACKFAELNKEKQVLWSKSWIYFLFSLLLIHFASRKLWEENSECLWENPKETGQETPWPNSSKHKIVLGICVCASPKCRKSRRVYCRLSYYHYYHIITIIQMVFSSTGCPCACINLAIVNFAQMTLLDSQDTNGLLLWLKLAGARLQSASAFRLRSPRLLLPTGVVTLVHQQYSS